MTEQRIEQQMELTREEEQFLIEAEQEEKKKPCFDARALRQMALTEAEINLLQVFFMKARGAEFNVRRFTTSECLQALVHSLKYLPKTDDTGKITLEGYKASDNSYSPASKGEPDKWSERFRQEYGHAMIRSHKERREPVLLAVLGKVFEWVEKFQKAHGIFQELPQWLQDGMAGDFRTDSWIGSDLYEGTKTREEYQKEQQSTQAQEAPVEVPRQAPTTTPPYVPIVALAPANASKQATLFPAAESPKAPEPIDQEPHATEKQKALLRKLMAERNIPAASLAVDTLTKREASRHIDELFQRPAGENQEAAA